MAPANLFSDLNQWILKILFSEESPESMLSAPRGRPEKASQLAAAARVSVMSAFRFVRQLSEDGFLEDKGLLRLVRIEDLLNLEPCSLGIVGMRGEFENGRNSRDDLSTESNRLQNYLCAPDIRAISES